MRAAPLVVPLAFAALLVSCQDGHDTSANDPLGPSSVQPSHDVDRSRLEGGFLTHIIPPRNITFTIGLVSPIDDLPECGGSEELVFDAKGVHQEVTTPGGAVHLVDRIQGTVVLYGAIPTSEETFCALGTAVIGRGRGTFIRTDNEFNGVGNGANAFGGTLNAVLDLTSGGRALFHMVTRDFIDVNGNYRLIVDQFELKPIGG